LARTQALDTSIVLVETKLASGKYFQAKGSFFFWEPRLGGKEEQESSEAGVKNVGTTRNHNTFPKYDSVPALVRFTTIFFLIEEMKPSAT